MEAILAAGFFALGGIAGSFVSVLAGRLHTGESWTYGRSRCTSCGIPLRARDLIPVVSWLTHAGRCGACGSRVSATYLVLETVLATLFLLAYVSIGLRPELPVFLLALVFLAALVLYDLWHTVIPLAFSIPFFLCSALFAYLAAPDTASFHLSLILAGAVGAFFLAFWAFSLGKAMGLGDTPVAAGLSLLVGAPAALPGLVFSFWAGAIVGIGILVARPRSRRMGIEVPFAPFLALGFLLAYFSGWNPFPLDLW